MEANKKVAAFAPGVNGRSILQMLDVVKELGFGGLELCPYDDLKTPDLEVAMQVADRAAELDLMIPCLSMGANLAEEDQSAQVERVKSYIQVAEAAGSPYIHFTLYPYLKYVSSGLPIGKLVRRIAPAVKELCDYAGEHHVGCVIEGQGYYMNGIAPLEQLLEMVDHPNLGIVADLGNVLCIGESPESFVGHFAPLVRHVHIKDRFWQTQADEEPGERWIPTKDGAYIRSAELGEGVIDIERCLRILKAAGYNGNFAIENTVVGREEKAGQDCNYLVGLIEKVFA